jgi:spore maturation protein CgeB
MRILIAGRYAYPWYEEACAKALEGLGHDVQRFGYQELVGGVLSRLEEGVSFAGPMTRRLNRALYDAVLRTRPDVLLVWRGTQIVPETLSRIRRMSGAFLVSYNNDDPFSPAYSRMYRKPHRARLWRYFRQCIPEYDLNFVFRPKNMVEYSAAGAKRVELLMPYFVPYVHRPMALTAEEMSRYGCDVVFVGHYESDGRADCLKALIQAGLSVRLYGPNWPRDVVRNVFGTAPAVQPVLGDEYAKALSAASACLSFHSKMNRDTYTRRSFEIPACEGLMLSERTNDLCHLFAEGVEALYFESPEELVSKARWIVAHPDEAAAMRRRARARCISENHDVTGRMSQFVAAVSATLRETPDRLVTGMPGRSNL